MKRVLHLKHQNQVGAAVISSFMDGNMRHVGGRTGELEHAVDKASLAKYLLVFYTKKTSRHIKGAHLKPTG